MSTLCTQQNSLLEAKRHFFLFCKVQKERVFGLLKPNASVQFAPSYSLPHVCMALSKQDLIAVIANSAGITKRAAAQALEALTITITKELKKGNSVTLTGFGTFRLSKRAARKGVNPRNPSQVISIPAMKVPSFKAGKTLKDAVR